MKRLSKLFLAMILVCSVLFSVACGTVKADELVSELKSKGFSVISSKNESKYASFSYLGTTVQKGDFDEIIATKKTYTKDEDFNYKVIKNGNYVEDAQGKYILDGEEFREVRAGETGTHSRVEGRYVEDKNGGYVYDYDLNKFVKDEDVNYFRANSGDYFYDADSSKFVTNDVDEYVLDEGGRYTVDKDGIFVYDEENDAFVEINDKQRYKLEDGKYSSDENGTFFKAKIGLKYYENPIRYTFDIRGAYILEDGEYVEDTDFNYALIASGNYVVDKNGDYRLKGGVYEIDDDVNYTRTSNDVYVLSRCGNYVKNAQTNEYELASVDKYYLDNGEYKRITSNLKPRYYVDGNGNYIADNNLGDYMKDGAGYKRLEVYVKVGDNYVLDTAERYAKVKEFVPYTSGLKFVYDEKNRKYKEDGDEVNYSFDPNLYVPDVNGDYVFNKEKGVYTLDEDVNYSLNNETGEYYKDDNGDYVLEEQHIVVLIFKKKKDARKTFDDMRYGFFTKHYYKLYGEVGTGYVSARNGNVIYMGHTDMLDALGDIRKD